MKYQHEDLLHVAFELVREERIRQIATWGNQRHDDPDWNLILGEERGEVEKAILEHRFNDADPDEIELELVQMVAVGMAWLEHLLDKKLNGR